MIRGSCNCGTVRFELTAPPMMMGTCHCSRCRKAGAGTFVLVARGSLNWIAGREAVASYLPEPPFKYARCFCRHCGTGLGEIGSDAETFPIAAHCLDDDPQARNRFHEWVSVKPAWYEICDAAKQFPENPG